MRPYLADMYAALAHKESLGDGINAPANTPTWVDRVDARRLAVYSILGAYRDNVARFYLPSKIDDSEAAKQREYGDVGMVIDTARSLILGQDQSISVEGADELPDDASEADKAANTRAVEFKDWLEQWAKDEHLQLKLLEEEEGSVGMGDGVFVLGWDTNRSRPRLRVFDAGWYFPDLAAIDQIGDETDTSSDDYPRTVHMAWEFEGKDNRAKLRRHTWRLVDVKDANGQSVNQKRPWSEPDSAPVALTCMYEDNTYDLGQWKAGDNVYKISAAPETTRTPNPVDLKIDFIPVVHIPCDAAGNRHFGRSILLRVAQLLDDLIAADSDLQANSALVASTPLAVTGGSGQNMAAGPGSQYNLPPGANAMFLDTSKTLDALLKYVAALLERLSNNSRLAQAVLGRVDPEKVPSGYAVELTFAPTHAWVSEMRLVRDLKFSLLLKFAMRMTQAYGKLSAGTTPEASIALGPYLPADKGQVLDAVTKLLDAEAISTETAVKMLVEAGYPIDDAQAEVERIRKEAFGKAIQLADATGDDAAVREFLKLPPKAPAPAPPPTADKTDDNGEPIPPPPPVRPNTVRTS